MMMTDEDRRGGRATEAGRLITGSAGTGRIAKNNSEVSNLSDSTEDIVIIGNVGYQV